MDEAVDEVIGDEVNGLDAIDGRQLRSKEIDYTLRSGNSIMLQSHEVVTLGEGDHYQSTPNLFTDILDRKNLDRIGSSEHASSSPRCMNDGGVMVEELTLRNYNGKNLAVVGTLGNKETMHVRPNQWFYHPAGGSACASSRGEAAYRDRCRTSSGLWEEEKGDTLFTGLLNQNHNTLNENRNQDGENLQNNGDKAVSNNVLPSSEGIRTKIISKSGFSEYIVKSTLKGKGIVCKTQSPKVSASESRGQIHSQCNNASSTIASMDAFDNPNVYQDGISLRERMKAGGTKLNKDEGLYIFKQVLGLVDFAHSQGISVQDMRPSCFKLLRSNKVVYSGASVRTQPTEYVVDRGVSQSENNQKERSAGKNMSSFINPCVKKQKFSEDTHLKMKWPQYPFKSGHKSACRYNKLNAAQGYGDESNEEDCLMTEPNNPSKFRLPQPSIMSQTLLTSMSLEEKWYTSPEQLSEGGCTFSSNIYCLGVLLYELLGSFDCERSHAAAMLDLRHRILPSCFLSEHPKEAGFCLWLLHPEPSARPTTREILQSEVIAEIKEIPGDVSFSYIHEEESESELLLYFLMSLKDQKQKDATKLVEVLKCIEADVQEVQRRRSSKASFPSSHLESLVPLQNRFIHKGASSSDVYLKLPPVFENETRLVKNIKQLESAYSSMRSNIQPSDDVTVVRRTEEVFKNKENFASTENVKEKYRPTDRLGSFFDGLCKYGRYSKFRARGILRNADLNNFANVICSLSFDRDEEYLAAGGVSKKIKIFEYHALFNDSVDIHYPIIEMSNRSKLSCICWNSYIRNYLATTDFDGAVKLWDASTGQDFLHLTEHNERAWSVDFSRVDPTKLASGSDDHFVKLWSINQKNSVCTIRNKANVCSVQFSPDSSHFLAYSSADYKTYCYDLRYISAPWCILAGHEKSVSYAKFLDAETLISASTDSSLKIWDLNKTNSSGYSTNACVLTLKGHTNEKNFVGLSVNNGYITCGSETNEVFAYYKSLPMPITSYKFGSIDPISGKETGDDNGQFVSSVCWRQKSNTVLAASSSGCIKVLEMV